MSAGLPLAVAIVVGVLAFSFSRVLLTVSHDVAPFIALAVAAAILGLCTLIALADTEEAFLFTALGVLLAVGLVVAGIVAAATGDYPSQAAVIAGGIAAAVLLLPTLTGPGEKQENDLEGDGPRGTPKRPLIGVGILVLAVAGVIAFGTLRQPDEGGTAVTASPTETPQGTGTPGPAQPGEQTVQMAAGDNFFDPNQVSAPGGSTLTIEITNNGQAIHNLHVPDANAMTAFLQPGETGTVTVTVPESGGTMAFVCDIHPVEMTGQITAE